jgi:hypothetical protein
MNRFAIVSNIFAMSALGDRRAIAMSTLGHKQTYAVQKDMSAFDPKRTSAGPFPVQV